MLSEQSFSAKTVTLWTLFDIPICYYHLTNVCHVPLIKILFIIRKTARNILHMPVFVETTGHLQNLTA